MSNNFIPPKESVYRNVKYRSRLEARWAVFLSQIPGMVGKYESITYAYEGMATYTPDFIVEYSAQAFDHKFLLEIKPAKPSQDYRLMLSTMAVAAKHDRNSLRRQLIEHLYVGCGDFYFKRPTLLCAKDGKEYSLETMFVDAMGCLRSDFEAAISIASGWRFDV